jgi:hypothetical protein
VSDQPTGQGSSEGFSLDIGGMLFHVQARAGLVHTNGCSVYFGIPIKQTIELWLAPKHLRVPVGQVTPAAVRFAAYGVTCGGGMVYVRAHALDKDGSPTVLGKRLCDGGMSISLEAKDPRSLRVCLELAGEGTFEVKRFAVIVRSPPVQPAQHNALLELIIDDFRAAEKAGAALPVVASDSILTYRALD